MLHTRALAPTTYGSPSHAGSGYTHVLLLLVDTSELLLHSTPIQCRVRMSWCAFMCMCAHAAAHPARALTYVQSTQHFRRIIPVPIRQSGVPVFFPHPYYPDVVPIQACVKKTLNPPTSEISRLLGLAVNPTRTRVERKNTLGTVVWWSALAR